VFTPAGSEGPRAGAREIDFRGRGYHDHRYGTGPLAATLRCWASGRVFLGDSTYAFHAARPLARGATDDVRLVRCATDGVRAVDEGSLRVTWNRRSPLEQYYPAEITCDSRLRLTAPRVIDTNRSSVRLLYHASAHGGREQGTAWCEVSYPTRNASFLRRWTRKGV